MRIVQGELQGRLRVVSQVMQGLSPTTSSTTSTTSSSSTELSVHRKTVGATARTAGHALACQTVLTGDAVALAAPLVVVVLDGAHVVLNVGPHVALGLHHLVHQDLLHLPVVEVVQVSHGVLGSGYEVQENCPGGDPRYKLMLTQPLWKCKIKKINIYFPSKFPSRT